MSTYQGLHLVPNTSLREPTSLIRLHLTQIHNMALNWVPNHECKQGMVSSQVHQPLNFTKQVQSNMTHLDAFAVDANRL